MREPTARSPFAGCIVMIVALSVMAFVLGYSVWSLFKLDSEIAKFTTGAAKPLPVATIEGSEPELNDLKARLEVFRTKLGAEPAEQARLALSPRDINQAIAAFDEFRDLRGTFHVAAIEAEHLIIDVSFPMNPRPFSDESRFLNATLVARPVLHPGEIALLVDEIRVPDAVVPTQFIEHFSPYRPLERYQKHPTLGPALRQLTGLAFADGTLVLRAVPGESPPNTITNEQVDLGSSRLFRTLAIVACAFLLFAGVVVFIGLRRSAGAKGTDDLPRL